jgi:hypothetical protein
VLFHMWEQLMSFRPLYLYDVLMCTGGIPNILNTTLTPASGCVLATPDTEEGGETIFPMSGGWANPAAAASLADASPCARDKVGAKAKMVRVEYGCVALHVQSRLTHRPCTPHSVNETATPCWLHCTYIYLTARDGCPSP